MAEQLIKTIVELAGAQRAPSFKLAAELAIERKLTSFVETGCYRGIPADGQSTLIMGQLARYMQGDPAVSIDINKAHLDLAYKLLCERELANYVALANNDSVTGLGMMERRIDVLYLDSFDYDPEDPCPCQMHQLAEVGAAYSKLHENSIILMDDNVPPYGGKTGLSAEFLLLRGWKKIYDGYQLVFTRR